MNDEISAAVELGDLESDGSRLSFRFAIDNRGREEVEVYASPRDSRRKGVFFLFSMDQFLQLEKIIEKARGAKQQLIRNSQPQYSKYPEPEIIDAILIPDEESEPRLLYEAAKKSHKSGNNTAAVAILKQIILVYPNSLYAKKAKKSIRK